uniref:Anoctamin n=1 Tax=Macrostomum lignano TaxID=282301 RepID=A0A1I8F7L4_9PLAT
DLTITITSERPDTEIELIPDEAEMSGINIQTFVDQQEWRLHEHIEVEKRTLTQEFSSTMKSHPCLPCAAGLPGARLLLLECLLDYVLHHRPVIRNIRRGSGQAGGRLQLSFTLFLTSVAFKFVINQSLPKISYLTYMEQVRADVAGHPLHSQHLARRRDDDPTAEPGRQRWPSQPDPHGQRRRAWRDSWQSMRECFLQAESGEPCSRHLRRMEMVNKDREGHVFISFSVLYVLAHVIFIFWLYYDACRRRREMRKEDREYKEWLNKKKEWHKKALEIANARRTSTVLNKIQFYQMVESHGRGANRKNSVGADLARRQHHQHHHRRNHNQLTGGASDRLFAVPRRSLSPPLPKPVRS